MSGAVKHRPLKMDQLKPAPYNPRRISPSAIKGLSKSIDKFGDISGIVWNERTGHLVCGHQRVAQLKKSGARLVDGEIELKNGERFSIRVVDWDEKKEKAANVVANNQFIAGEFTADLKSLTADIEAACGIADFEALRLDKILKDIENVVDLSCLPADPAEDAMKEAIKFENRGIEKKGYHQTVLFDSNNRWGIPELREDMLSSTIPLDVWAYNHELTKPGQTIFVFRDLGSSKLPSVKGEILAFYCDDDRFEKIWDDAVNQAHEMNAQGWGSVITPDFSLWRGLPLIVNIWNIYRAFWCGRYWQEIGIPVIPSLNWSDEDSYEFAFIGIPKQAPVVSCQCQTTRTKRGKYYFIKGLSAAIRELEPQNVVIYGGESHRKWIEPSLKNEFGDNIGHIHFLRSRIQNVTRERKSKCTTKNSKD